MVWRRQKLLKTCKYPSDQWYGSLLSRSSIAYIAVAVVESIARQLRSEQVNFRVDAVKRIERS